MHPVRASRGRWRPGGFCRAGAEGERQAACQAQPGAATAAVSLALLTIAEHRMAGRLLVVGAPKTRLGMPAAEEAGPGLQSSGGMRRLLMPRAEAALPLPAWHACRQLKM